MNLLILFSISVFVGLAKGVRNLDDNEFVVERRVQSSGPYSGSSKYDSGPRTDYSLKMNRNSPSSYGSGVESKYSSKMGSYNHGSTVVHGSLALNRGSHSRGSTSIHGSGTKYGSYNRGSTTMHRSSTKYGSSNQGSNAARSSKHVSGSGSMFYSSKYIWHLSGAVGSNARHGSNRGSGPNGGSSPNRGSGSKAGSGSSKSIPYDIFAPTMRPTYWLPPIYTPPPPTHNPTKFQAIPPVSINFNQPTISGIEVPQIPLSFQIQQGANGWSQYPDSPPLLAITKVAAKTAGVAESAVTNMKIAKKNRRSLASTVTITYDITTTPEIVGQKTQEAAYYMLVYKLQLAVKNNNFSSELHKLGVQLNISSISFSEYMVYYPTMTPTTQQNVLLSGGAKNDIPVTEPLLIGIGVLLAVGIMASFGFLWYKTRKQRKSNPKEVELIPEVERPSSLARISNPMIDVIPRQTNRISFDQTQSIHIPAHNE
jgi:hypothetical protein